MRTRGSNNKSVFLCGAGATKGAVGSVRINKRKIEPPLNGNFFRVVDQLRNAYGESEKSIVERIDRIDYVIKNDIPRKLLPGKTPSMEDVFSLLYVTKDLKQTYKNKKGRQKDGPRREVEDFLKITFRILNEIECHSPNTTRYDDLVSKLDNKDTIITLNYDTLLDQALFRRGWDPSPGYGLKLGKSAFKWRPKKVAKLDVKLLKLHGSLNWFVRGSYGDLGSVFESKPKFIADPRLKNEHSKYIRQIVPPIYGKFFSHTHWDSLWAHALKALVEAEDLYVIGCSMVATDFHLSGLLHKVVVERKRQNFPFNRVVIVNGRKKKNCKWAAITTGCRKNISYYPTFERFCDSLINAT